LLNFYPSGKFPYSRSKVATFGQNLPRAAKKSIFCNTDWKGKVQNFHFHKNKHKNCGLRNGLYFPNPSRNWLIVAMIHSSTLEKFLSENRYFQFFDLFIFFHKKQSLSISIKFCNLFYRLWNFSITPSILLNNYLSKLGDKNHHKVIS